MNEAIPLFMLPLIVLIIVGAVALAAAGARSIEQALNERDHPGAPIPAKVDLVLDWDEPVPPDTPEGYVIFRRPAPAASDPWDEG